MEEKVAVLTVAELIHTGRPLTGTASLHSDLNRPVTPTVSSNHRPSPAPTNSDRNPKVLTPLNHPAFLLGTLTIKSSHDNCIKFKDISAEVCCDILDFNVRAIGKKIYVTAWNFIPLKRGNGFLEIIKWKLPDSSSVLTGCSRATTFDSFPLISGSAFVNETYTSKASHRIHGAVESVSPVSIVPCSNPASLTGSTNIQGFLVRVMTCECKLCSSKENKTTQACKVFTKPVFVYFCGAASCWHPVMIKLSGHVITISGLKKKLVFIAKEESQLMFVTVENSVLHVPRLSEKWFPVSRTVIKGKGECGVYTGVVKGVYMRGMIVELDNEVWLLLNDKLLSVPHSLREGAVISLRNVHFVNPRFPWAKLLILGACFKTSIIVESFSPLEAGCYRNVESQSLLGKFVETLSFSARLWALLVVSCIRKKFCGILSEKEILGSKHRKGVAQMYASSHLPSSVIRARHGVFTELCKHESCGCGNEPYCGNLKLVLPISCFTYHCEAKWIKMLLQSDSDQHLSCENCLISSLSSSGKSYSRSKRRIFPSEDMGIVLLGSLKVSPYSGRLQLVDMTGSIDVIVPDLSLNWSSNSIYEVVDYGLIVEGITEVLDQLVMPGKELFSCRSIFNCAPAGRKENLSFIVHFHMSKATSRNLPFYPSVDRTNDLKEFGSGAFHLIRVTHKFPLLQKFQGDLVIANRSSMFVEAIILPWSLALDGKDGSKHSTKVLKDQWSQAMEHGAGEYYQGHVPGKRHKTDYASSGALTSSSGVDLGDVDYALNTCCHTDSRKEWKCETLNFPLEIPCFVTVRSISNSDFVSSGILYCAKSHVDVPNLTAEKVLLQFNSEDSLKYQLLQIGGYYIIKHHIGDPFCSIKDSDNVSCVKALITSKTHIWSLTYSSDEVLMNNKSSHDPSPKYSSFSSCKALAGDQIDFLLQRVAACSLGCCSDVHLHLSANAIDMLKLNLKKLEQDFIKPAVRSEEASNISPCSWNTVNMSVPLSIPTDSNCLFPEGNLVSLQGDVIALHAFDDNYDDVFVSCEELGDAFQLRFSQELPSSCIHVLVDHQLVKVFGTLNEHVYLSGFGAGVNATFHRILEVGGSNSLMLTSVSFIVINSMRVVKEPDVDKFSELLWNSDTCNKDSRDSISSGLISELAPCLNSEPMRIRCRVVAVHFLVLEKKNRLCDDLQVKTHSSTHLFNIPLACFVLDDGSSSCCCWADAERAATLLRLHEQLPQSAFESSGWTLKWVATDNNAWRSTVYHIERILKKYDRITVKNYGSMVDSSCQNLSVSVNSENALSCSDENLLKFIISNACFGTFWTLVASSMDPSALRYMGKQHLNEMEMTMHSMQNIWAKQVCYTNPITEARNVFQELINR
ncbi:CST complex subunit CTC1 isoform X4 [Mangifera indica]|uniref:CST complex subunit CTC1 isoform X4 n=1 Tax=Mangifera indica TaxID=29780 RepID=UPI001CFB81A3|nr:CST complex subunit CTC1 isoform X4 [Mangifera indica]